LNATTTPPQSEYAASSFAPHWQRTGCAFSNQATSAENLCIAKHITGCGFQEAYRPHRWRIPLDGGRVHFNSSNLSFVRIICGNVRMSCYDFATAEPNLQIQQAAKPALS